MQKHRTSLQHSLFFTNTQSTHWKRWVFYIVVMDYKSKRWNKVRARILRLDGYMDVLAKRYGKIREANTVHHIYPADQYPEWVFEDWNLISLSSETHNKLHDRQSGELIGDGLSLQKRTEPGVNWRTKHSTK